MFGRRLGPIVVEPAQHHGAHVEARLRIGRRRERIRFGSPDRAPIETDDPFVPIALLLGMKTRRRVRMEGPVSAALAASLPAARDDLGAWYPHLRVPRVGFVRRVPVPPRRGSRVASFFSGGLDSFYTAVAHADAIEDLLFVHGFDVPLEDRALRARVFARVHAAAGEMGARLVQVETDLRTVSDRYADWSWFSHAGLVAVALLLAPHYAEILVPATLAAAHGGAADRGPVDRESWAGGLARIRSDGAEATRPEKARRIATSPAARAHLRVCWENRDGAYNCGRCPKCVRTLLDLEVAGVRSRFPSIPGDVDVETVRALPVQRRSDRQLLEESLWMAAEEGRRPDLARALRDVLEGVPRGD